jgi:uncharacterized protein YdaU (DUF1376 family)
MPFYPADFRADTLDLTAAEIGAYIVLLMLAWQRGGPIPGDAKLLRRMIQTHIADFHGHSFNAIIPKLLERYFYKDEDGDWRQKRIEKEIEKAESISKKQSQNVAKRWSKEPQTVLKPSSNDSQMVGKRFSNGHKNNDETKENNDLIDTVVIPITTQSHTQHKDISRGRKRAQRLPQDWILPDQFREAARKRGLSEADINRHAARMHNWSLSASGGAKIDWYRAWLNWIDDAPKATANQSRDPAFQFSKPVANF